MFDKLATADTSNTLGKITKRSKRTVGSRRKMPKFLIEKGNTKLTTDEVTEPDKNDLEEN